MNWAWLRQCPWLDTRAKFVATVPIGGALLDLGSAQGETLRHMAELRPDLRLHAVDLVEYPGAYPSGCRFQRVDLERGALPWPDHSIDAVTCMHLIEHLHDLRLMLSEIARVLKVGGQAYFETPHEKTVHLPSANGRFTFNFYDDSSHVRPVEMPALTRQVLDTGLQVVTTGTSRNWLFAGAYPFFLILPPSRKKYIARVHWVGWSAYLVGRR